MAALIRPNTPGTGPRPASGEYSRAGVEAAASRADALADLLRVVRLDGAYCYPVEARGPWRIQIAATTDLRPRVLPGSQHVISYHAVASGRCVAGLVGETPIELGPGDAIVFAHGDAHVLGSEAIHEGPTIHVGEAPPPSTNVSIGEGPEVTATLVCGFLGCDVRPFNPLIATLPRVVHVRTGSGSWHGDLPQRVAEECRRARRGSDGVIRRIAELMLIEVLRRHAETLPRRHEGWLAGWADDVVGTALGLLHARPGDPWTLHSLARAVGTSRSTLAQRFAQLVGRPPMQYLADWRIQLATNLLADGDAKVAVIGRDVGYDSEAAFSRAFKRATGVSPRTWRDERRKRRAG